MRPVLTTVGCATSKKKYCRLTKNMSPDIKQFRKREDHIFQDIFFLYFDLFVCFSLVQLINYKPKFFRYLSGRSDVCILKFIGRTTFLGVLDQLNKFLL